MTNERLAEFIQEGGNDELIPILWERVRVLMYMKSDRVYTAMRGRFIDCGVEAWDIKQVCYMAFLKAIKGYKSGSGNKFVSYLSYPFKTAVTDLLGYRTQKVKHEPLNNYVSLDLPLNDSEVENITLADSIADETATAAYVAVDTADEYRLLHDTVDALRPPMNTVINAYFFENKSLQAIGDYMGVSRERVRQIKAKALLCLKRTPEIKALHDDYISHHITQILCQNEYKPDCYVSLIEQYREYFARRI